MKKGSSLVGVRLFLSLAAMISLLGYSLSWTLLAVDPLTSELYSHVPLVLLLSGFFLWKERKTVFSSGDGSPVAGGLTLLLAVALFLAALLGGMGGASGRLSLAALSSVLFFQGASLILLSRGGFHAARFPLAILLFAVPLPDLLLQGCYGTLQWGSAWVASAVFTLLGIPFFREGLTFQLPGLAVEVAQTCSGLRSLLALLILGVVGGRLFLKSSSARWVLALLAVPLAILKNGLRVVLLSLLAAKVDMGFLEDSVLHRRGGALLFLPVLVLFFGLIWLLQRWEGSRETIREKEDHP